LKPLIKNNPFSLKPIALSLNKSAQGEFIRHFSSAPSLEKGRLGRVLKREVAEAMKYRNSSVVMEDNEKNIG
jgi:hypothetical protein